MGLRQFMKTLKVIKITALLLLFFQTGLLAHGGGLDDFGCHHNKKLGGYHCHRGKFSGKNFSSKAEAFGHLQDGERKLEESVTGLARIVDGDTIHINGVKIRLHGIDAPETRQKCFNKDKTKYSCGKSSTDALRVLVGGDHVRCEGDTYDRYRRLIATCYSGSLNLNA